MTTTCYYLVYALSTICYTPQPVPALQPLPVIRSAPLASVYAAPNVWDSRGSVIPTWQDILQNEGDDQ